MQGIILVIILICNMKPDKSNNLEAQKTHDRIQQECWVYGWNKYPATRRLLFHPANELRPYKGEPEAQFIRRLMYAKSIGVVPGVLDLIFLWSNVYAWDIKIGTDRLSDTQIDFVGKVRLLGGECWTVGSKEEFIPQFDGVMSGRPLPSNIVI